jgi:hypothetical protein
VVSAVVVAAAGAGAVALAVRSSTTGLQSESVRPIGRTAGFGKHIYLENSDVGCTLPGSCVAVGSSWSPTAPGAFPPPYGAGLWSDGGGRWHYFHTMPGAISGTDLYLSSCVTSSCVLAGQSVSGDAIWRYSGASHRLVVLATPRGGAGVVAMSCWGATDCLIADVAGRQQVRFFSTEDLGRSWQLDRALTSLRLTSALPWDEPDADYGLDSISCRSLLECVVADSAATVERLNARGSNAGVGSSLLISLSGGRIHETWLRHQLISAVQCFSNGSCEAMATGHFPFETIGPVDEWLTFDNGLRWWGFLSLLPTHNGYVFEADGSQQLSCPRLGVCVMVDQRGGVFESSGKSWVLREPKGRDYLQVSCGIQWCVAGNNSGPSLFAITGAPTRAGAEKLTRVLSLGSSQGVGH